MRAAQGKHLLVEKPIAVSVAEADALAEAVERAGVASAVYFTSLYQADVRRWLAEIGTAGAWSGASAVWLGSALMPDSPFNTPWRRAKGGLWDLGPHLVALLWNALGPVDSVTADVGAGDVTHLVLHHRGGQSSVLTVAMDVPESKQFFELYLWGPKGRSAVPREAGDPVNPLRTALTELSAGARSGDTDQSMCGSAGTWWPSVQRRRPVSWVADQAAAPPGRYLMCRSFLALAQLMTTSVGVGPQTPAISSVSLSPKALPVVT